VLALSWLRNASSKFVVANDVGSLQMFDVNKMDDAIDPVIKDYGSFVGASSVSVNRTDELLIAST
jgi:hypothetical protein